MTGDAPAGIYRNRHVEGPAFCEGSPLRDHARGHDASAEDMHAAGWDTTGLLQRKRVEVADVAVLEDADFGHSCFARKLGVPHQVVESPVNGDEGARLRELEHAALLLPMRVPADVHGAIRPPRSQLDASPQQIGDHARDTRLVARDDPTREN